MRRNAIRPIFSVPTRDEALPAIWMIAYVVVLFAVATFATQEFSAPIKATISDYPRLGILVFLGTAVVAVLVPVLTNLPLAPVAVVAWGSLETALLLLVGWIVGSAISLGIGRHAGPVLLQRLPSSHRHAQVDRLINPQHRISSLVMLRMTFPVDVLSYALGLFSKRTTLSETTLSTALGGAPFALLFAYFPALDVAAQLFVFVVSLLAFTTYTLWVLRN